MNAAAPPVTEHAAPGPPTSFDILGRQIKRSGGQVMPPRRYVFSGWLRGEGSSQRDEHTHPGIRFAVPRWQCSACRWHRSRLWRAAPGTSIVQLTADGEEFARTAVPMTRAFYVLQVSGMSAVPGEVERSSVSLHDEIAPLIRTMVITDRGDQPYLPDASLQMLDQAAEYEDAIDRVWDTLIDPLDRRR